MPSHTASNNPNAHMRMSVEAKARMRSTERAVYKYYNDMGKNKGHCTWGAGILAHRGVCSEEELGRKVSVSSVEIEFERAVGEAERGVKQNVVSKLNQSQFDALVSLTYNVGVHGASDTYALLNKGDFTGAAMNISTMTKVKIKGKRVLARGLIRRRAEESAPFRGQAPNP
nr:glycoside hydrolase family protein [uncultured Duganella sp.]